MVDLDAHVARSNRRLTDLEDIVAELKDTNKFLLDKFESLERAITGTPKAAADAQSAPETDDAKAAATSAAGAGQDGPAASASDSQTDAGNGDGNT